MLSWHLWQPSQGENKTTQRSNFLLRPGREVRKSLLHKFMYYRFLNTVHGSLQTLHYFSKANWSLLLSKGIKNNFLIFFTYSQSINVFLLRVVAKYWTKSHEWSRLFQLKHIQLLINTYFKRYSCLILFSTKLTSTSMATFNLFKVLFIST